LSQVINAKEHLTAQQKTVLFRVAQESLTNVVKHAQAGQVDVTLRSVRNGVQMRISDNGKGFAADRQRSVNGKRLGLLGMQERVRLVNGRFEVKSMPCTGTTIAVEIPLKTVKRSDASRAFAAAGMNSGPPAPARTAAFAFSIPGVRCW
jgi:signal transduction histidine kinase